MMTAETNLQHAVDAIRSVVRGPRKQLLANLLRKYSKRIAAKSKAA